MFFALLVSYLVVLLIPILIGSFAYVHTARIIAADVSRTRLAMLQQVRRELDAGFGQIRRMCWQISSSRRVREFLPIREPLTPGDRLAVYYLVRELRPHLAENPWLRDFYIYFRNSRRLVTPASMYEPPLMFRYLYAWDHRSGADWHDYLLNFDQYTAVLPSHEVTGIDHIGEVIAVVQSIPMDDLYHPEAVLVALLDSTRIRASLDGVAEAGYAAVLGRDGEVLLETGNIELRLAADVPEETNEGILFRKDRVTTFARSETTELQLVSVLPRRVFLAKLDAVRNLIFAVVGACVLVGLLAAYLMAYRSYRPIRGMMESLARTFDRKPGHQVNELEFIHETVLAAFRRNRQLESRYEDMIRENRRFREQINRNSDIVKNGLLARLIRGRVDDFESALDWLARYGVRFPRDRWQIVVVHIDADRGLTRSRGEGDWRLVRFLVGSLTREMSGTRLAGEVCELEFDMLGLILNWPSSRPEGDTNREIAAFASRVQEFIRDHYDTEITVGIGHPVDAVEKLSESYARAQDAVNYRIIKENASVIRYDEITGEAKAYHYPIEVELRIINSVRSGDYGRCSGILDQIYETNMSRGGLSIKLARCLVFDMIGTALRVLDQINVNYVDVFGEGFDPVEELVSSNSVPETYRRTRRIYREICAYLNHARSDRHIVLRERVLAYIREHYLEETLSQTEIADEMGITAPYLSSFFKQETGTSMVDHINRLRIEKAKALLAEGGQSLSQVAGASGFGTDKTLIRLFKRFEGVTPGRFRELRFVAEPGQEQA
jgi:AraC-like DNA-binding protein